MNKASGKLAAGVRKIKTQQKSDAAADKAAAAPAAPKREVAAAQTPNVALHPARVWPD